MTTIKLPRIKSALPIVDGQGRVNNLFLRALNDVIAAAESQIGALAAAVAAQAAATAAAASAAAANAAADEVATNAALANSFATGLTIAATDAGASATISITAHTRVYADGVTVAVNAGNLTGLAYGTSYWIAYDQASRLGGAVTYVAYTTSQGNATINADRHFVGAVITPEAGGLDNGGRSVLPPGGFNPIVLDGGDIP